jgi:hypothetical protein
MHPTRGINPSHGKPSCTALKECLLRDQWRCLQADAAQSWPDRWTDTTLWTFSGGSDGCFPVAPLIADERGAIYGTTQYGGSFSEYLCLGFGCGVVFKLTGTGFVPD